MIRIRYLILLALVLGVMYVISPPDKKRKIREKVREFWWALTIAMVLYWICLLIPLWKWLWASWKGDG